MILHVVLGLAVVVRDVVSTALTGRIILLTVDRCGVRTGLCRVGIDPRHGVRHVHALPLRGQQQLARRAAPGVVEGHVSGPPVIDTVGPGAVREVLMP